MQASSQWYQDKFGLEIILEPPKANNSTVIVLEGGGLIVELIQEDNGKPLSEIAPTISDKFLVHGMTKAGIIVQDFDAAIAALRARNVPIFIGPFPKTATQRANAIIQDNEGNLIGSLESNSHYLKSPHHRKPRRRRPAPSSSGTKARRTRRRRHERAKGIITRAWGIGKQPKVT